MFDGRQNKSFFCYNIIVHISFVPDTWIDISSTLETKLEAMAKYETELRDYPHPRSLKALEYKAYATGNECLMEAAESFMTIRKTIRNGKPY